MTLPRDENFATQVRIQRLQGLTRSTIILVAASLAIALVFRVVQGTPLMENFKLLLAGGAVLAASALAQNSLKDGRHERAAAIYAYGLVAGVSIALINSNQIGLITTPFIFSLVIFISGLLFAPSNTFLLALVSAAAILLMPSIGAGQVVLSGYQIFAVFLVLLSAVLASQVTGELFQVTEWALMNFQRARRTNSELDEKRAAIAQSLEESEMLSRSLQDANVALDHARASAEEARHFRGQFLANMSHELRTPLNAIIGFSETMLQFPIMYDDVELPPPYQQDLNDVYQSGRQLLFVINDILDLAKSDAGKLELHRTRVEPLMGLHASAQNARESLDGKPVRLIEDYTENLPPIFADDTRLRQVLSILLSNALKYTDEGSIRMAAQVADQELVFSIADTGIGIPEERQPYLFQEFQQSDGGGREVRAGAGLGLVVARQILHLMDGRIWFESQSGQGSTFHFALPLYQGQDQITQQPTTAMPEGA